MQNHKTQQTNCNKKEHINIWTNKHYLKIKMAEPRPVKQAESTASRTYELQVVEGSDYVILRPKDNEGFTIRSAKELAKLMDMELLTREDAEAIDTDYELSYEFRKLMQNNVRSWMCDSESKEGPVNFFYLLLEAGVGFGSGDESTSFSALILKKPKKDGDKADDVVEMWHHLSYLAEGAEEAEFENTATMLAEKFKQLKRLERQAGTEV